MMQKIRTGFSLIELLVVVAIIGILAAIGVIGYNKYIHHARVAASTANAKLLADALNAENTKLSICGTSIDPETGNSVADNVLTCAFKIAYKFNLPELWFSGNCHPLSPDKYPEYTDDTYGSFNLRSDPLTENNQSPYLVDASGRNYVDKNGQPTSDPVANPEYAEFKIQYGNKIAYDPSNPYAICP